MVNLFDGLSIEVARHLSFEGVNHKVHPLLHHLHLGDYVRRNCIGDGWLARVQSLWPAQGITSFRTFFVPSFSTGAFLVFLLGIHHCVFLAQLFL